MSADMGYRGPSHAPVGPPKTLQPLPSLRTPEPPLGLDALVSIVAASDVAIYPSLWDLSQERTPGPTSRGRGPTACYGQITVDVNPGTFCE